MRGPEKGRTRSTVLRKGSGTETTSKIPQDTAVFPAHETPTHVGGHLDVDIGVLPTH